MSQEEKCVSTGMHRGRGEKKRKLINSIHTVIFMTFILILDVMTAIFAACTAVILIRMETALLINFLFREGLFNSLYGLSLNTWRQAGVFTDWGI